MRMNVRGWRAMALILALWLVCMCAFLLITGCCRNPPPVDVDKLNAAEQARLQAQADLESKGK